MSTRIGVDVGGTFTDLIFFDEETGRVTAGKGPSNPHGVDLAVRSVVTNTLPTNQASRTELFLHGTTVGLNALLERKGARVGLLTTSGFRDILEQARMERLDERGYRIWDHLFRTPPPLVDRPLRVGVRERILADGTVHLPLDPESVREAAVSFAREGVDCVAIVFINSHANSSHELEAEALLRSYGFSGPVSLSHQTTGQYREYERTSTTVIDAYVRPAVAGYLARLESGLREDAVDGECLITTSAGGCIAFEEARIRPFETVMSGPVAGAVGASTLCRTLDLDLAITADVGGTSFDTCLLVDGRPTVKYEGEVVGMPLQTPWVDVRSVGAGGGSIAHIDNGLLSVGPQSAGAIPGPVAYGRGGTEPTVTDAAVTLGMFARTTLASGLELDIQSARDSLSDLAYELGLDPEAVAQGVIRIAAAAMAGAMRAVSIEVGQDPRDGALIAYGGAGPLFSSLLARELQIKTLVIPNYAGNFSAWGLLEQDMVRSAALTIIVGLDADGIAAAERTLDGLFTQLEARVENRVAGEKTLGAEFDLRYQGQEYSLALPIPLVDGKVQEPPEQIAQRFAAAYERNYGHSFEVGTTIVSVRAIERTALPRPADRPTAPGGAADTTTAQAYSFAADEWREFTVIDREGLSPGDTFAGPAIVLEKTATTYLDIGMEGVVRSSGALVVNDTTL